MATNRHELEYRIRVFFVFGNIRVHSWLPSSSISKERRIISQALTFIVRRME